MLPDAARLLQAARRPDLLAKLLADGEAKARAAKTRHAAAQMRS
jgi:hypothetical protein